MMKNIFIGVLLFIVVGFICFNEEISGVPPIKVALLGMIVTLTGWFVSYKLARKNTATQAKNAEINKTIEQIEAILKSLSDYCLEMKIEKDEELKSIVAKVGPNKAKVSRIKTALDRLKQLDESQEDLNKLLIRVRQLATDEDNFKNNIKATSTATNILSLESQFISKMERRF